MPKNPKYDVPDGFKRCSKGENCVHPLGCVQPATNEYFRQKTRAKGGLQSACKACAKECANQYRKANPAKVQQSNRKYRETNPDKVRQSKHKYRAAHLDRESENNRQWREANRSKLREYRQEYREANRSKLREYDRQYYAINRNKKLNYNRQYRAINTDKLREQSRQYRAAHLDRESENNRQWREANRSKLREYRQEYREANRSKLRESNRQYRIGHKGKRLAHKQRRRARELSLPDVFTAADWQRALDYFGGCCAACGRTSDEQVTLAADHWIPLASPLCPGTIPANIVPLCHTRKGSSGGCNNSKSNRNPVEWLVDRFGARQASHILARIEAYFASLSSPL